MAPRQARTGLGRDRVRFNEKIFEKREEFLVDPARFRRFAVEKEADELNDFRREKIGRNTDYTHRADRQKGQSQRVVAAQDGEAIRRAADQFAHPIDASARFLDRDNVRAIFRQPNDCVGGDVDATAPRECCRARA